MNRLTITVPESATAGSFKPYLVNGYLITAPLRGDNSGFSKWGFCTKDGREYFIKEFVNPVYPSEKVDLAADIRERKIALCHEWYNNKKKMYAKIQESQTGNLIAPVAFFRNDSHFYLVTEKVEKSKLDYQVISSFGLSRKIILLKVLSSCFMKLADNKVVHADVKPDNLLIKETRNGFLTIKVIDFDASYLEECPPFGDEVQGDPVYYAPETFLALMEEEVSLTTKVDVFGLGIVFHQLLCGKLPQFDKEYDYVYEAVLNDSELKLSEDIPEYLRKIIAGMLKKEIGERLSIEEVFNKLCSPESSGTAELSINVGDENKNGKGSRWHIANAFDL